MKEPPIGQARVFSFETDSTSQKLDALGMRPMQARAWRERGQQYLLIKAPPASGKSRALMFIALDKLHHQGVRQAVVTVPERAIGASFRSTPLTGHGFAHDWRIEPRWNLCDSPQSDQGRVDSVRAFLEGQDRILVCTHATFRFAVDRLGAQAFDDRLIAIDEFHHVSADIETNRLGELLHQLLDRGSCHITAMTGSYFRGDAVPVLLPEDEKRFQTVTYTYAEQLNGYTWLKSLDLGHYFYSGRWIDDLGELLDPDEKTILHIPHVGSRESTGDKYSEVNQILELLGEWQGTDPETGFHWVKRPDGRLLRVADLVVDDPPGPREKTAASLRSKELQDNRDYVDLIIALGMAKEGFDWIWCEHALTVGYRASLTEIVQIIGRVTRDAQGKERVRFTNLIAEPIESQQSIIEAINNTLKAIAASLLMEQVLVPNFSFTPKTPNSGPVKDLDYGKGGYDPDRTNVGFCQEDGKIHVEIKGLAEPKSDEAKRICEQDIHDIIADTMQNKDALTQGVLDQEDVIPEEITRIAVGKIVRTRYPDRSEEDQEAVRQHAVAAMGLLGKARKAADEQAITRSGLIEGVRRFVTNVRELDVDMIDAINPFAGAYNILAKSLREGMLNEFARVLAANRSKISEEEARELARRAVKFQEERGRVPHLQAADPWERRMAEGVAALERYYRERQRKEKADPL